MASNDYMIDVYIKTTKGAVVNYPCPPSTNVHELCLKIAKDHEDAPEKCVVLKYTGKVLKKQHSLSYLGVRQETILKVEIQPIKLLNLVIKKDTGETFQVALENLSTIWELKCKINDQEDIDKNLQHLKFKNQQLTVWGDTLQDCGIDDESVIELSLSSPSSYEASVESPPEELDEETKQELLNSFAAGLTSDKKVEVVFSFDTTGSMASYLGEVRQRLRDTVTRLLRDIPNIRIGIVAHGDYCDQQSSYVIRHTEITADVDVLVDFVDNVPGSGGEGNFACYEWVLKKSQELNWTEDAAKALVILGDVVPHGVNHTDQKINWHDELDRLCQKEIKVYGVRVRDYEESVNFYEYLAEKSGGAYIRFQHFNVVTDMFLAVCYRETGREQLDNYCEEVAMEGRMTEELTTVLKQLKEAPTETTKVEAAEGEQSEEQGEDKDKKKQPRYVNSAWWDPSLDQGKTRYSYDAEADSWSRSPYNFDEYSNTSKSFSSADNTASTKNSNSRLRKSFRKLRRIFKKD